MICVRAGIRDGAVACPACSTETTRVHEYGERMVADVPAEGRQVLVKVQVSERWHLWHGLGEAVRKELAAHSACVLRPVASHFHPVLGRPSTPAEWYLRLRFLKFRYRLGYESLCAEVSDSISWRRFCRLPLDAKVPHPTTLMKLTTRCGEGAVAGLNEALLARSRRTWPTRRTPGCWPGRWASWCG